MVVAKTPAPAPAAADPGAAVAGDSTVRRRTAADAARTDDITAAVAVAREQASHSIRADSSLDKAGEFSQGKRQFDTTIAYRRRKVATKPERPPWKTVLSIVVKNVALLLVLYFAGHFFWKSFVSKDLGSVVKIGDLDFERRMMGMDDFWKRTASMVQVQVDALDKKIGKEVGSVKGELTNKLDDKNHFFEEQLKKLDTRVDGLDKSLIEYKDLGFFSRQELDKFFQKMKEAKGLGERDAGISLDEIRAYAREVVGKEIEKHAADGLGLLDYALGSGGGKVVRHSEPLVSSRRTWLSNIRGQDLVHEFAKKVIEPSLGEPGQCLPLKGSEGFIEIRLRYKIFPDAVTLEHVAESVAYDRTSAPKSCTISGWYDGVQGGVATEKSVLAEFTYDLDKSVAQTFSAKSPREDQSINMVRLDFTSNHGSSSHTCIYRLRVHGRRHQ